jgi:hypothetical protein
MKGWQKAVCMVAQILSDPRWDLTPDDFWYWQCEETGEPRVGVMCSDVFWWGTSDVEEVSHDDMEAIYKAMEDGGERWGLVLFCCRKRGMRPQKKLMERCEMSDEVRAHLLAAGPERTS